MAGKRPDQHNIDPREAGATDYKTLPEAGHGRGGEFDTSGDKQRLTEQGEEQPFLPDVPSPSAEANRAMKARQGQLQDDEEPDAEPTRTGKENPLA